MRHNGHTRAVHGNVEGVDGCDALQLARYGGAPLGFTEPFDILADGFRDPFHGFGLDDHAGQFLQVAPPFIEGFLGSHPSHHASDTRTEGTVHDVELLIFGNDALLTAGAMVVGPLDFDRR